MKKKAIIRKGIIFTIASGALVAGINSATALSNENGRKIEFSKIKDISSNNNSMDLNKLNDIQLLDSAVNESKYVKKSLDNVIYKVEIKDNFSKNKSVESVKSKKIDNTLEKLKISGYINFNSEGDFVSVVDIFNGSRISISDRINPEKLITKENEESIFNPLNITGTEVMIVDNNLYKLDIDDYSTIHYELVKEKATINLFKMQIARANNSVSQVEEYNNLIRVQSNISELEITGINLEKYDIEALSMESNFAPILLAETYNKDLNKVTAKYSRKMFSGDEVFIVTDNYNNVEGIYKIDNFNSPKLEKIKVTASISNILKTYEERSVY